MEKLSRCQWLLTPAGLVRDVARWWSLVVSLAHLLILSKTASSASPMLEDASAASSTHAHDLLHAHHVHMLLLVHHVILLVMLLLVVVTGWWMVAVVVVIVVMVIVPAPGIAHVVPAAHAPSASPAPVVHTRTVIVSLVVAPASSV